ncbi:MAG: hypothetical protein LBH85_07030 [Treponema sp.]|nr:hypothetical protein [Treponema sp.]
MKKKARARNPPQMFRSPKCLIEKATLRHRFPPRRRERGNGLPQRENCLIDVVLRQKWVVKPAKPGSIRFYIRRRRREALAQGVPFKGGNSGRWIV